MKRLSNRIQIFNPKLQVWVKLDTQTGAIVSTKKSIGPYKNIPTYVEIKLEQKKDLR